MSSVVVIIPVYNGEHYLHACLSSLDNQHQPPSSIIAVENGSSDQSAALIASAFPHVRLLRYPQPLGFARAVNLGLRAACALPEPPTAIALLNQDTAADPGWLAALMAQLSADPAIGIVGSISRFRDGSIQHAGAMLELPRWYGKNTLRAWQPGSPDAFLSFLGVAIRHPLLATVGLLDEEYGAGYYEDADYCLRAVAVGWQLSLATQATLLHHEGAKLQYGYQHAAAIERNRVRTILKHYPVAGGQIEVRDSRSKQVAEPTDDPPQDSESAPALWSLWDAERAALIGAANAGDSQVLRQAYLHGLMQLPAIARTRGLDAAQESMLASTLASLRDEATRRERVSRTFGIGFAPGLAPAPSGVAEPTVDGSRPEQATQAADLPAVPIHESEHSEHNEIALLSSPGQVEHRAAEGGRSPRVTIVMLTWNGMAVTQACIASIRAHTDPRMYQLLVVDNGSSDGTLDWLRAQPDVTLIANPDNRGFTQGNNQGMAAAAPGSDLLLLNNDTLIAQDGWLERLYAVAHSGPAYGVVGCILLHSNGRLQHAGTYMPDSMWGYQIGGGERYVGQYPGVREVDGITGACMYIRREVYTTIGGLDPAYFSYYEDTDYCLRAQQAGFKIVCIGDVQITHHENTSSRVNQSDWQTMFSAGRQVFERKWRASYDARYTRSVVWHSLFAAATGYATSSRELVRELDSRSVDVRTACIFGTAYTEPKTNDPRIDQLLSRPADLSLPQVVYSQADAFIKNGGRVKIGFTMHETDRLPDDWVRQCNAMDEVWTPTTWGADVFRASGVNRPVHVIPLGFRPEYFHPGITSRKPQGRYVFLSVFDWIERKAPDLLLRAYLRTFRPDDDVLLLLKISNSDPYFDLARHMAQLVGDGPTPPITVLLNQPIAPAEMGVLYRSADCFVLPTRGEGWGMPTLEAMACGLPVISTGWGAQADFLHDRVGYPLRISGMAPAVTRSPYYAGTHWAEPDIDQLCDLMRYVYNNPAQAKAMGAAAASEVHTRWTWGQAAERIITRLDAVLL